MNIGIVASDCSRGFAVECSLSVVRLQSCSIEFNEVIEKTKSDDVQDHC